MVSYRLGPVTAYNLDSLGTTTKGREKLYDITSKLSKGSRVLLCFGEIDVRAHIVKQSRKQRKSIEEIVDSVIIKYRNVIAELKNEGFELIIWLLPPPTSFETGFGSNLPIIGTFKERLRATKYFNKKLGEYCKNRDIKTISIYNYLIEDRDVKMKYFVDPIHLSIKTIPLVLKELENLFPEYKKLEALDKYRKVTLGIFDINRAVRFLIFYLRGIWQKKEN